MHRVEQLFFEVFIVIIKKLWPTVFITFLFPFTAC